MSIQSIRLESCKFYLKRYSYLLICISFAVMFLLSLGKWPDPLVDFGRELYVPWAMTEGKKLYTDIFYFNGPLSPYWNKLLFDIFGVSLSTLVFANLGILAALTALIWFVLKEATSVGAAVCGCIIFILMFAFSQYVGIGNYNYVTPYSHEVTHGMLLSWIMLACVGKILSGGGKIWNALAGFSLGMIFLTKPEFFLASSLGMMAFSVVAYRIYGREYTLRTVLITFCACLGPIILAYIFLNVSISFEAALKGLLGSWYYVAANAELKKLLFYKNIMGISNIQHSVGRIFIASLVYVAVFVFPFIASLRTVNWTIKISTTTFPIIILCYLIFFKPDLLTSEFAKPLPVFMLIIGSWALFIAYRDKATKHCLIFVLTIFSFTLLLKIILNVRIYHYGFILAMPAIMVSVVSIVYFIPKALRYLNGDPRPFLTTALIIMLLITFWHLNISAFFYEKKNVIVGNGRDVFLADWRGNYVNATVNWLKKNTTEETTLLVLPEGIMINYLARRFNATPIVNLMPPEVIMLNGEKNILKMLEEEPPNYVILIHKDTSEYGYKYFGKDFGRQILEWIKLAYEPVLLYGSLPFHDERFGVMIMKYKK